MKDLISVIITVYNNEKTLRDCIFSVISQTYRNIEIIIIDDGSTDDSSEICNELLLNNSKTKVIHQIHSGLSSSRNKGLEMAMGKYVTFVNASDKLENDFLENLYLMISSYMVDIAICSTYSKDIVNISNKIITLDKVDAIRQLLIEEKYINTPCGKLFTNTLFSNIKFSSDDVETLYKLFEQSNKIAFMNKDCYLLRERPTYSLSSALNNNLRIMQKYPELSIYCKCNIVKDIQDEFYNSIVNNKPIKSENEIYETFKKIIEDDGEKVIPFFNYLRRAHLYLLANDLQNYKIVCPVLPELKD